jgi:(1->4)-alpha-D-glucan 1-alpha-D-glucosylmutase
MSEELVKSFSNLFGIADSYADIWGNSHPALYETKLRFIAAHGVDISSEASLRAALEKLEVAHWNRLADPVVVVVEGYAEYELELRSDAIVDVAVSLELEDGSKMLCSVVSIEKTSNQWRDVSGFRLRFRCDAPCGYHKLSLRCDDTPLTEVSFIVTPRTCYFPPGESKYWGVTAQLYSIRSKENWGIGDFGDARRLAELIGQWEGDFLGLQPLHALFAALPEHRSPYAPNSRLFCNVLLLEIEAFKEFDGEFKTQELAGKIDLIRADQMVDYVAVAELKLDILKRIFDKFERAELARNTQRAQAFLLSITPELRTFAVYETLSVHLRGRDKSNWGWPVWPEEFRDPESLAVSRFAEENEREVLFHCFLQWCADLQLEELQELAVSRGLTFGLYLDLALGTSVGGAETWVDKELFAFGVSAGAPPDLLNVQGQTWGLPPYIPAQLKERAYKPFIDVLRRAMKMCGMVRLDHFMGLMRLFWIPEGKTGAEGAYVSYMLNDLIGIVALESMRNQTVVIGEDLGTVPDEVRETMVARGVLSYQLLMFMKNEQDFLLANRYKEQALVAFSTHDLPTLLGYLKFHDLEVRKNLNLYSEFVTYEGAKEERKLDLRNILGLLGIEGFWEVSGDDREPNYVAISAALHAFIASTPCRVQAVQLEDLVGHLDQMNLPGTVDEHPNWKQKLSCPLDVIASHPDVLRVITAVKENR